MQMYRGLDIVTNKVKHEFGPIPESLFFQVTVQEQEQVRHHAINILDPLDTNNVVDFRNRALPIVERLLKEGKIPFICGGTNYYIESLLWKILVDQEMPLILNEAQKRSHDNPDETKEDTPKKMAIPGIEDLDSIDFEQEDNSEIKSEQLFGLLERLDPARAMVLHPKERRKVWRSLQVKPLILLYNHLAPGTEATRSIAQPTGGGARQPRAGWGPQVP